MILNDYDIARFAAQAGFKGESLVIAIAVALAESGGDPAAANEHGEHSYGLWQINLDFWGRPNNLKVFTKPELLDPAGAARAAYIISRSGSDWSPWSAYTKGTYRSFLGRAAAAVADLHSRGTTARNQATVAAATAGQAAVAGQRLADDRLAAIVRYVLVPLVEGRANDALKALRYIYALAGAAWPLDGGSQR